MDILVEKILVYHMFRLGVPSFRITHRFTNSQVLTWYLKLALKFGAEFHTAVQTIVARSKAHAPVSFLGFAGLHGVRDLAKQQPSDSGTV